MTLHHLNIQDSDVLTGKTFKSPLPFQIQTSQCWHCCGPRYWLNSVLALVEHQVCSIGEDAQSSLWTKGGAESCSLCSESLSLSLDQLSISLWHFVLMSDPKGFSNANHQSQTIVVWKREMCALCWDCKAAAALLVKTYALYIFVCLNVSLFLMNF